VREKAKAGTEKNREKHSLLFLFAVPSSLAFFLSGVVSPFCLREKERE